MDMWPLAATSASSLLGNTVFGDLDRMLEARIFILAVKTKLFRALRVYSLARLHKKLCRGLYWYSICLLSRFFFAGGLFWYPAPGLRNFNLVKSLPYGGIISRVFVACFRWSVIFLFTGYPNCTSSIVLPTMFK